eukprot:1159753-Pelagomonas_calceolata.AAC.4
MHQAAEQMRAERHSHNRKSTPSGNRKYNKAFGRSGQTGKFRGPGPAGPEHFIQALLGRLKDTHRDKPRSSAAVPSGRKEGETEREGQRLHAQPARAPPAITASAHSMQVMNCWQPLPMSMKRGAWAGASQAPHRGPGPTPSPQPDSQPPSQQAAHTPPEAWSAEWMEQHPNPDFWVDLQDPLLAAYSWPEGVRDSLRNILSWGNLVWPERAGPKRTGDPRPP